MGQKQALRHAGRMSALGQEQKLVREFARSAFPLRADILSVEYDVRYGPTADIGTQNARADQNTILHANEMIQTKVSRRAQIHDKGL